MATRLPLAWLQLSHGRVKLLVALAGVVVAVLLMLMQLGFMQALFASAVVVPGRFAADLIVISPQTQALFRTARFPRRLLYRLGGDARVESARGASIQMAQWHNPWSRDEQTILVYGLEPGPLPLTLPGLAENWDALRTPDTVLFDASGKPIFGPVAEALRRDERVDVEVNRRRVQVAGLVEAGSSFATDGNLFTSDLNFRRIFPDRRPGGIDLGLVRLRPGVDATAARDDLQRLLGVEAVALTRDEFVRFEQDYWRRQTPIGFIFTFGTVVGFCIGFVIVYQILYTDVSNHLPRYATMKAMGFTDAYLLRLVLKQALILAALGYGPGLAISSVLYAVAARATALPIALTWERTLGVFAATVAMCGISGAIAVRRLRAADPADVF